MGRRYRRPRDRLGSRTANVEDAALAVSTKAACVGNRQGTMSVYGVTVDGGGGMQLRRVLAVALLAIAAGSAACSSSDTGVRGAAASTPSRPGSTSPSAESSSRDSVWEQLRFRYPSTWTLRQFPVPSAPTVSGPYLANRALRSPCTSPTDTTCTQLPVTTPLSPGTVWARWMRTPLPTPGVPSATVKITVNALDDAIMCPTIEQVGARLGSFTAEWLPNPLTSYRLVGCFTTTGADKAVAALRAIAGSVVLPPSLSACDPAQWGASAGKVSPYSPGGGVHQVATRIAVTVDGGHCRLPVEPHVRLLNDHHPVGSSSVLSPLSKATNRIVNRGGAFHFAIVWTPGTDKRCRSAAPVTAVRMTLSYSAHPIAVRLPKPATLCLLDTVYVTFPT